MRVFLHTLTFVVLLMVLNPIFSDCNIHFMQNKITTKRVKKIYVKAFLNIENAEIPQIIDNDLSRAKKNFNQYAANLDLFKDAYFSGFTNSKITAEQNESQASLDKTWARMNIKSEITLFNSHIISVRFTMTTYLQNAAHPNTNFYTINYDLKNDRLLNLKDIFSYNTPYLENIARYSIPRLNHKYGLDMSSGAKGIAENYSAWNLTPQGLLISYNQYPFALGIVSILIPYSTLKTNNLLQGVIDRH